MPRATGGGSLLLVALATCGALTVLTLLQQHLFPAASACLSSVSTPKASRHASRRLFGNRLLGLVAATNAATFGGGRARGGEVANDQRAIMSTSDRKGEWINVPRSVVDLYSDIKNTTFRDWRANDESALKTPAHDPYPSWLEGTWDVRAKFSTAEFPLGRSKLTMSLAGARRMSCGPMPNVGSNARNFLQRFIMTSDNPAAAAASTDAAPPIKTVEPDWEFNMGSSLRAFWPEAELVSANIRKPSSSSSSSSSSNSYPKFIVEYTGPTKRYKEVGQGMAMSFISTEGFLLNPDTYVIGENVEQENVEQQLVTRYRHVRSYERRKDGNILSRQRIAAFANPDTDEALYSEANGRPIAIYEYYYLLRPSADNV